MQTGAAYGFRIRNVVGAPNVNIFLHRNNIVGFATAGLHVDEAPMSPENYANCNWWGSATGPTNALNPGGTGDIASGFLIFANFSPWLLGPAPDTSCGLAPIVTKEFNPTRIKKGGKSLLTITIFNPNLFTANIVAPLVDPLPEGVKATNVVSTTCGGSVSTSPTGNQVILSGGAILGTSSCIVTAQVQGLRPGRHINLIIAGALQTNMGDSIADAIAELTVYRRGHGGGGLLGLAAGPEVHLSEIVDEPVMIETIDSDMSILPTTSSALTPAQVEPRPQGCSMREGSMSLLTAFMLALIYHFLRKRAYNAS